MARWPRGAPVQMQPGGLATPALVGLVERCGRSGDWADVLWMQFSAFAVASWRKRQPNASLLVPADAAQVKLVADYLGLFGPAQPGSPAQAFAVVLAAANQSPLVGHLQVGR